MVVGKSVVFAPVLGGEALASFPFGTGPVSPVSYRWRYPSQEGVSWFLSDPRPYMLGTVLRG